MPIPTLNRFTCKICDVNLSTKKLLDEHRITHTTNDAINALKCPNCPRTFTSFRRLRQHKELYYDETPEGLLLCHDCGKLFKKPADRKTHEMHNHIAPDIYKCTHLGCTQGCPTAYALQSHLKSHKTERPYKCPHCIRWFKQQSHLSRHTNKLHPPGGRTTPDPDKPFQCSSCVKQFAKIQQLAKHVKSFHQQEGSKWEKRLETH
jgi:KRAB domain-containing zinc finger protein